MNPLELLTPEQKRARKLELNRASALRYGLRHPEKKRAASRASRRRMDPVKKREVHNEWCRKNPDLVRAKRQRSLARLRADPERVARRKEYMRAWGAKNPEKRAAARRKRCYGLTAEQYDAMLERQGGKCAICQKPQKPPRKQLHVDHRHSDGVIRGLLCFHCNAGIGHLRDDIGLLRVALKYLEQHA